MSDRKPCEICGETDCEDSSIEYYIECWKKAEAALKEKDAEIARLRKALEEIIDCVGYDYCEDEDTGNPCGYCPWCIANKTLEA